LALAIGVLALLQPQAFALDLNTSDLTVSFSQSYLFLSVGQTVKLTERTTNLGNESSPSSSTIVEAVPDGARTWLHKPKIAGYSYREDTFNYTCFTKGEFTLIALADYYSVVNETNESNNRAVMAVHCLAASLPSNRPDLTSAFSVGELSLLVGQSSRFYEETRNKGEARVSNTSTSIVYGNGTRVLLPEPPLGVLESFRTYFDYACEKPGRSVIASTADADDRIAEYDETNNNDLLLINCGSSQPQANLVSSFAPATVTALVGARVTIYENTSNAGSTDASASVTSIRLPGGSIRRFNKPPLAQGAFKSDFITIQCSKTGTLLVESAADYTSVVEESNEEDNPGSATIKCVDPVYSGYPDLASEFLDANITAYAGETIAVHERTFNTGDTSPPSKTRVWWAHGIDYFNNLPLAKGESRESNYAFFCKEPGVFTVSSFADSDLAIPEADEDNNRAKATVTCRAADGSVPNEPQPTVGAVPWFILEPPKELPALGLLQKLFDAIARILSSLDR
jgi:subtilase family serine protease